MSDALVQPVWLPPRTTLGAPNTIKSPAAAASRAVSSLTGNSAMPTPCERNAFRIAGVSSSCESVRTLASRAPCANRAIDAGTYCAAQTGERCGYIVRARNPALNQALECLVRKAGTFDHAAALLRLGQVCNR